MNIFPNSKVEPHIRELRKKAIPEAHQGAYLDEFIQDYILTFGSSGLCSRFPGLSSHYRDPPGLGTTQVDSWSFPTQSAPVAGSPGSGVTLGSPSPFDLEIAARRAVEVG